MIQDGFEEIWSIDGDWYSLIFPKREKKSTCTYRPLNTASYVWNHHTFSCILPGCGSYQGADYPLTPALIEILL